MPSLSLIAVDPERERKGVWVTSSDGFQVLVARMGNMDFNRALERLRRDWRDSKGRDPSDAESLQLWREAFCAFVVRGWRDVQDLDGKPLEYSPDAALAVLTDERFHELGDWIIREANKFENYRLKRIEETQGNSGAGSSGSSTGVSESTS